MKEKLSVLAIKRALFLMVIFAITIGACKSKKKAIQTEPEPAPVERVEEKPKVVEPAGPTKEELAVEKLESAFNSIAAASSNYQADQTIQQTIPLFSNQDTPILIVIHEENGIKDYDEPTTVRKYLEYLKDTKKNLNFISDIRLDASGKVSELELRRK